MKNYPHPILAKEGWPFIGIGLILSIIFIYINVWVSIPIILITLFIIQFFRDPARKIPEITNAILAPADGKIICIEQCDDPYQKTNTIKISIFMNVFNVHSNRSPINGEVVAIKYIKGKFFNADFDKASLDNERNILIIKNNKTNDKITVVQIAGLIARRILCYTKVGDHLTFGQRFGFIRFGSRVDIYLPTNYEVCVSLGQKVTATTTIIAKLKGS